MRPVSPSDPDRTFAQDAPDKTAVTLQSPRPAAPPDGLPALAGHCRIVGEIGRGGMGVVLHGRDERLGRDLAVKLLRDDYRGRAEAVRRFLEEAQIGGQLQHPGVVPIHGAGCTADGRPYFTMKLVRGRTLADLLAARPDPTADRPHLLGVFAQVCQTVAYAHSRGVVHRDLKPQNVMVGAFGEVQVMDWGLAKVIASADGDRRPADDGEDTVKTVRTASSGSATAAGSVIGTPAYIAPEQARGDTVDERCDVFGLGAVLGEILTGRTPYADVEKGQVMAYARAGDLGGTFVRLDACGADADLVRLAKDCLTPAAGGRPRHGAAVADAMSAYLASVQERLRAAEIDRAAAAAKADEARVTAAAEPAAPGG